MYLTRRGFISGAVGSVLAGPALADEGIGIIFIGASWCHVCKQAAPMLQLYSGQHGIPVLVASGDDRPIAPFEAFVPSSSHPLASAVSRYPTTLVFSSTVQTVVGSFEGYRNPSFFFNSLNSLINQARAL